MNYYNEFDQKAAAWIRKLIKAGLIPNGEVDERSITDVKPSDLTGYAQCHFFAGIGGWPYALRLAGWPDERPVWTGSAPCQPFSVAGKGKGLEDERHLWPAFRWLIAQCRPSICFGEQVASKDGRNWLSGVRADLEALGYGVGAADICAASVGAPHIRQRLWWVGHSTSERLPIRASKTLVRKDSRRQPERSGDGFGVVNMLKPGLEGHAGDGYDRDEPGRIDSEPAGSVGAPSYSCRVADSKPQHDRAGKSRPAGRVEFTDGGGVGVSDCSGSQQGVQASTSVGYGCPVEPANFWGASVWWPCIDGKWRRVPARQNKFQGRDGTNTAAHEIQTGTLCPEPSLFPLASGVSSRVGLLRGAGNAIVPQVAAEFIGAAMETMDDLK